MIELAKLIEFIPAVIALAFGIMVFGCILFHPEWRDPDRLD